MINIKQETYYALEYYELDEIINDNYPHGNYEFVADEEANNYCNYTFNVSKENLDAYDLNKLNEFISTGGGTYLTRILLTDLVNKEIIPEGKYLIKVSW